MQKKTPASGFTLFVAVIFMSVILTISLALGSLGYKQQILTSGAIASQNAFYAADSAMECALYADQGENQNIFAYPASDPATTPTINTCDEVVVVSSSKTWSSSQFIVKNQLSLDSGARCADVTVYKNKNPDEGITTYIFSQGYDVPCTTITTPGARFSSRGIQSHY